MDNAILLAPLDGKNPSGQELRNDARFDAAERLLKPAAKVVRVLPDGTLNPSATPIDWSQFETDALEFRAVRIKPF